MGGIVSIVPVHRRVGCRWIWSYLVIGSVAWSGVPTLAPAAAAEAPTDVVAPPNATGERPYPGARVPGTDEPTFVRGGWSFFATGVNSAWQGSNIDDDLKTRGLGLPDPNEMKRAYDVNPSIAAKNGLLV